MKSVRLASALALLLALALSAASGCGKSIAASTDDATISTRVKTALLNDPDVAALRINVQTFQGVVTLSGAVRSQEQEQKAVAVARTIHGVKDVKSELQIQQSGTAGATR